MVFKSSFKSAFLTGLIALLPLGILIIIVLWFYSIIRGIVAPILQLIGLESVFYLVLVALIVLILFIALIGFGIRTHPGQVFFRWVEEGIFHMLPGYKNIKKIISHFTGAGAKSMYRSVALIDIFQNGTLMTGFIIEKSSKTRTTVFIPTGPNPTSGLIYHVLDKQVTPVDISVERALESVIAVGKNSNLLFSSIKKLKTKSFKK